MGLHIDVLHDGIEDRVQFVPFHPGVKQHQSAGLDLEHIAASASVCRVMSTNYRARSGPSASASAFS